MEIDLDTVGKRLKSARAELKISQAALAKRAGVAIGTIGNIEAGFRERPRELLNIAVAAEVNPAWLETGKGERKPAARVDANGITPQEVMLVKMLRALGPEKVAALSREADRLRDPDARPLTETAVEIACEYMSYPPEDLPAAAAGASAGMTQAVEFRAKMLTDLAGALTPRLPAPPVRAASQPKREPSKRH